ncbi:hypothetical protein B5F77_10195 [Parabacteroides sp. An277]|nr:hypothetical protein B5F77_10195 [Parabacteroides sp. An277]
MLKLFEGEKRGRGKLFFCQEEDAHRACEKKQRILRVKAHREARDSVSGLFPLGKGQETASPACFHSGKGKRRRLRLVSVRKVTRDGVSSLFPNRNEKIFQLFFSFCWMYRKICLTSRQTKK